MQPTNISAIGVPEFLGGLLWGLTAEDNLQEIQACYQGGDLMFHEIEFALSEFHADGWDATVQAILELGIVILQVPQALHTCENMQDDIAAIADWASIFTDPARLSATIAKHLALHHNAIMADVALDKTQFAAGEYWKAGVTTADLATLAIGPINPVYPTFEPVNQVGIPVMAIPDFIAGMIYGFTGDNDLEEIEACYHGGQDIVTYAGDLIDDLSNSNWVHAIHDYDLFSNALEDALSTCTGMEDDFAAIEAWAEIFTEPTHLAETVAKNWILHKRGIKKDMQAESEDWASGNYFGAGVDTADALVKLIGPVE